MPFFEYDQKNRLKGGRSMKSLYDAGFSRQDGYPSHFPWDDPEAAQTSGKNADPVPVFAPFSPAGNLSPVF